jgi:hypothetical protein
MEGHLHTQERKMMRDAGSAVNGARDAIFLAAGETSHRIFSQDFFDPHQKIKFSFFLVAIRNGFYSRAAGRVRRAVM